MVKITLEQGQAIVNFSGDPIQVAAELASAIGAIYQGLQNNDSNLSAEIFKMSVQHITEEGSPIWSKKIDMVSIVTPEENGGRHGDQ